MTPQANIPRAALGLEYLAMTSDLDIFRSAKLLINQHGDNAAIHASMQADAMLAKGDLDGKRAWVRIIAAIEELQGVKPGETKH